MKIFLLAFLAAVMLASCTKSEIYPSTFKPYISATFTFYDTGEKHIKGHVDGFKIDTITHAKTLFLKWHETKEQGRTTVADVTITAKHATLYKLEVAYCGRPVLMKANGCRAYEYTIKTSFLIY